MIQIIVGVVVGLITLTILVVIHELGHAYIASKNGVKVEEFGVGFPPSTYKKKLKNGVLLSINWLPLGGFVKLQGEYDSSNNNGDYGKASYWSKTKILFAGVCMNWLFAALLISILAMFGLPKILSNQFYIASDAYISNKPVTISSLVDNYPAQLSGIEIGDELVSLNGEKIDSSDELITLTKENKGKLVEITVNRSKEAKTLEVALRDSDDGSILGAGLSQSETIRSTWSSPIVGIITTAQFTGETINGVYDLFANLFSGLINQFSFDNSAKQQASDDLKTVSDSVTGPIGILGVLFPAAEKGGIGEITILAAIISISLAVMNILPIPALDGGRWLVMTIYKIRKKRLTKEKEEKIQSIGFSALMILVIIITVLDVTKIIK